jgi:hypothetical protein
MTVARVFSVLALRPPAQMRFAPHRPLKLHQSARMSPLGNGPACLRPNVFSVPFDYFSYEVLTIPDTAYITHIRYSRNRRAQEKRQGKQARSRLSKHSSELNHRPSANLVSFGNSEREQYVLELEPGADKSKKGVSPWSADELQTNVVASCAHLFRADVGGAREP